MNRITKYHQNNLWTGNVEPIPQSEFDRLLAEKERQERAGRDKTYYARGHEDGYATGWVHAVIVFGGGHASG